MTQIQSQLRARRRIPKLAKSEHLLPDWPQSRSSLRLQADTMLRDMAFVLHVTESVKRSLLEKTNRVEASSN